MQYLNIQNSNCELYLYLESFYFENENKKENPSLEIEYDEKENIINIIFYCYLNGNKTKIILEKDFNASSKQNLPNLT